MLILYYHNCNFDIVHVHDYHGVIIRMAFTVMEQIIDWAHDTFLHSIYIAPHLHNFVVSLSCGIAISSGRQNWWKSDGHKGQII